MENVNIKTIFDSFDKDKSGSIDKGELKAVAKQLGCQLTQAQTAEMMNSLDINGDGKIQFDQFQFWWTFGFQGKLKNLVVLQTEALKAAKTGTKLLRTASDQHKKQGGEEIDSYDYSVSYGQKQPSIRLKIAAFLKSKAYHEKINDLKKQYKGFDENFSNFILMIYTQKSQEIKKLLEQEIQKMKKKFAEKQKMPIDKMVKINIQSQNHRVKIVVRTTQMSEAFIKKPQQQFLQFIDMLGNDFFFNVGIKLEFDGKAEQYKQAKKILDALILGFKVNAHIQTSKNIIGMIKSFVPIPQEIQNKPIFQSKTFNKILKTPQELKEFLESIGIHEKVQHGLSPDQALKKSQKNIALAKQVIQNKKQLKLANTLLKTIFNEKQIKIQSYIVNSFALIGLQLTVKESDKFFDLSK